MGHGLYVHVPFCVRKCAYCAFYSRRPEPELVAAWLAGVERELGGLPEKFSPGSVFFGGGTPTALSEEDLARLLDLIHERVDLHNVAEWTCEANPGTLTPGKAARLKKAGVDRLSIGAQSFDDATLTRLGRIHTSAETRECIALARAAGFDNLGLDVIYGVPGVSRETFCADVEAAMALDPEHISCYCLEIEEGTPFAREEEAGRLSISEDEQRGQFDWARKRLAEGGWTHYEISNFAKPGRECRQNLLYWSGKDYIGIGPAAHSHWNGVRWGNSPELPEWKRAFEEKLAPEAKARETLVMGLRRIAGWSRAEFRAWTGFDYEALRGKEIAELAKEGLLVAEPGRIRLADDALFVSDSVFSELV
ncbi:MAG TPA: coproporphyrinogen III oxidase [Verrucomicrobia bacterium]|nr:coproporphyrinogen III oxidase [Verrucomicrobiota bacterium]